MKNLLNIIHINSRLNQFFLYYKFYFYIKIIKISINYVTIYD